MSTSAPIQPAAAPVDYSGAEVPSPQKTLRQLFLMLFLRGRTSRGLRKQSAPKSIGQKLGVILVVYAGLGLLSLVFLRQPIFALAVYLHAMTFVFLGMFVASTAGEILFNNQEADVLLHRPIEPRALLWAKVRVLVEVSLWIAAAFNLVGLFVGVAGSYGNWQFPLIHAISTTLEALFTTGCVVMIYQLCLRWFGREKLEALMTTSQVIISIAMVLAGQVVPQFISHFNVITGLTLKSWWIALLPPAWFAGLDDAIAGSETTSSWLLAGLALAATAIVLSLAFGKLAQDYQAGLQRLSENTVKRRGKPGRRRWIDRLVDLPPLRWWLRDSVARASFLLTAAYLTRDRDVKLRIYPAMAPYLVVPIIFMVRGYGTGSSSADGFSIAFVAAYLGLIPMMALSILPYSQQWQATDIFRTAPLAGPAALCNGARRAVLFFLALPGALFVLMVVWFSQHDLSQLLMLLPGLVAMPIFALLPTLSGKAVPLSIPVEGSKAAGRGVYFIGAMLGSMALSGAALWARSMGWFWWFMLVEAIVGAGVYVLMRRSLAGVAWQPLE